MMARSVALCLTAGWLLCTAGPALAQDNLDAGPPEPAATLPENARGWEEKPRVSASDVVLFLPRVILAIPRYALEIVFFPIRLLLQAVDDYAIVENVIDLLYNDERTAAILPSVAFLTGFGGTIGFTAFHNDLFGHGESLSLSAKFGGIYEQAYQLAFETTHLAGTDVWIESRVRFERARTLLFEGIGDPREGSLPAMPADPRAVGIETRYREERFMAMARGGYTVGPVGLPVRMGLAAIYNHRSFETETGAGGGGRSIETVYDTGALTGFGKGVDVLELKGSIVLDWRDARGFPSSGAYVELFGGYVPRLDVYSYGHYGLDLSGYLDLYRGSRVLIARAALEAVTGDDADLPFSELPRLGGPRHLRGYILDRFRDRRAAVGSLEYRYPIHRNVMGHLFVDAGKVAPDYGDLVDSARWRVGYGFGLVVGSKASTLFALDLAFGDGLVVSLSSDPLRAFAGRDTRL